MNVGDSLYRTSVWTYILLPFYYHTSYRWLLIPRKKSRYPFGTQYRYLISLSINSWPIIACLLCATSGSTMNARVWPSQSSPHMAGLVCSFNIYPATLALYLMLHCLDVGEHIDLDVCIHAKSEGPFSCNLLCELENCDKTLSLPISGKVDVSPIMFIQFMCFICTKF